MTKVNVYLPDDLAAAVRDANVPVSAVCQAALKRVVREVAAARAVLEDGSPVEGAGMGLYARFTPRARNAVVLAQRTAADAVGTEHVLVAVLDQPGNMANLALADLDVSRDDLRGELAGTIEPTSGADAARHSPFSADTKAAIEAAAKEAIGLGHSYIGCEHLLLGILATERSRGSQVLRRFGVETRTARRAVVTTLHAHMVAEAKMTGTSAETPSAAVPTATLDEILARLGAIERRLPLAPED